MWKDVAGSLNMNPKLFKASFESVFTRNNPLTNFAGQAYDGVFREVPREKQNSMFAQFLIDNWDGGVISLAKETNAYYDIADEIDSAMSGPRYLQDVQVDELSREWLKVSKDDESKQMLVDFINKQPVEDRDRLYGRIDSYNATMNMPDQKMWRLIGGINDLGARAQLLHRWLSTSDKPKQKQIWEGVGRLQSAGSSIIPKDQKSLFWFEYGKLISE
jgi:hypothetical protein